MIEQSPAVRALGAELAHAIRLDHTRRIQRRRALTLLAVLVLIAGVALRLAPDGARPANTEDRSTVVQVMAASGSREPLGPRPETVGPPLRDAPWLYRLAAFVN
jgi:hypothetical protein